MNKTFEITIPVLNEQDILESSTKRVIAYLVANRLDNWQVTIADNGSTDETPSIAASLCSEFSNRIRYIRLEQRGVGLAIRQSWTTSEADVVGYMDADLATDINHLQDVESLFNTSSTFAINGSRLLPGSNVIGRSLLRELTSRGLNIIMGIALKNNFTDAMCGFKFFDRQLALNLLDEVPVIPDWFVAAELLVRAEWHGYDIHEIPVTWSDDSDSKANIKILAKQYLHHIRRLRKCKKN
jgi:glycosyltransferase involved in cell wall biosynthesis